MTHKEMFGEAKWVASTADCEAPLIRGSFCLDEIVSAEITVCGLGFFELYLNGRRVGDDMYVPANSDYEERELNHFTYPINDTISHRIYCLKYDIIQYLLRGENSIGVIIGNGWYNQYRRLDEGCMKFGSNKLCFKIEAVDKSGKKHEILSDESLKWAPSHITENNLFYGETHDYAAEKQGFAANGFNDSVWKQAEIVPAPVSSYYLQDCPSDKAIRFTSPKRIKNRGDVVIYDAGENISGFMIVACPKAGEKITVRYADEINADGSLNFSSSGGERQIQTDVFITAQPGREYSPKFCWHAFRYAEISGNAEAVKCAVVHSDVEVTSAFECDNETLNWLYDAYIRTQLSNMHGSVPSDCPHRERLGYTGDGQLCCDAAMLLLGSRSFYKKWMDDIADCQDTVTGHVQHTAPFSGGGGGPGGWGGAIVEVPYTYYKHFGDAETLSLFYPRMLKYLDYMESRCENGLVVREEEGGWCLGDWCTPEPMQMPESFVNTYFYIRLMKTAQKAAAALNEQNSAAHLDERIKRSSDALKNAYYSPHTRSFMGGIQGADAFGLDIGLGIDKTFGNVVKKYRTLGMYDTGIFGTDILTRILFEKGEADLAFSLLASEKETSFFHMKQAGATTLWENWNGESSHSHPMFGAVTRFLFYYLLGIRQAENSTGFEKVVIAPVLVNGLNRANGYITTARGRISLSYEKMPGKINVDIYIDEGIDAVFSFRGETMKLDPGKNTILRKL